MGFRFRKSINIGGFRINLSKSGVGYSYGATGYRVTRKASGGTRKTVSIPHTGISYVKESGKKSSSEVSNAENTTCSNDAPEYNEIKSELVNSCQNEFVEKLNKATTLSKILVTLRIGLLVLFVLIGSILMNKIHQAIIIPFLVAGFLCFFLIPKNAIVNAEFVFDNSNLEKAYTHMISMLNDLAVVERIMEIESYQVNVNKLSIVPQKITISKVTNINCDIDIKSFNVQKKKILFLPNIVAVLDNGKWFAIEWNQLRVNFTTSTYIDENPANDTKILRQTYKYVTKSGAPDKRYNDNPIIYECEYGAIELETYNGLHIIFIVSNGECAQHFCESIKAICEIKQ